VLSLLYDVVRRIRLFVEDWTLLNHRGKPHLLGLWDQVSATPNLIPNLLGPWDQVSDLAITPRCYCVPAAYCYCSLLATCCALLIAHWSLVTYQLANRLTDQLTSLLTDTRASSPTQCPQRN